MCGICGHLSTGGSLPPATIDGMVATLAHRGPDDRGAVACGPVVLGHTRLSILDLSCAGHQPMRSPDGRYLIAYNGEVYNFRALREQLRDGWTFHSDADTEVVLAAFARWGTAAFARLHGMFAISLWDAERRELHLARDPFGIKPLYFARSPGGVTFGSELKAVLASGVVERRLHLPTLHEYMWYGNSLGTDTFFAGVERVAPGERLVVDAAGSVQREPFWTLERVAPVNDPEPVAVARVRSLVERAVASHLVSDVPVGVFLSGGVDSSAITAFASRHYDGRLATYSVGFDYDRGINELPRARRVAERFGTDHHELHVAAPSLPDVIRRLVDAHDEPFADAANIPLFLLCEQLRGRAKVILQGDGGDELFAGYRRYAILAHERAWRALRAVGGPALGALPAHPMRDRALRFVRAAGERDSGRRAALLLTMESEDRPPTRLLSAELRRGLAASDPFAPYVAADRRFAAADPVQRMLLTDLSILLPAQFLEKVDRATMAHGIEVRVPFLDRTLAEYAIGLPSAMKVRGREKKYVLRRALRGVVPDEVLDGPKTGFGVPYAHWLRTSLAPFMRDVLLDERVRAWGLFDRAQTARAIDEHVSGARDHGFLLWKCLQLALWHERYVDVR